jgi:ABC-type multidrug transport system fused ATPase/permease subunit
MTRQMQSLFPFRVERASDLLQKHRVCVPPVTPNLLQPLIHNPAGKMVVIVEPSGCGKSTVFCLLYRFYEPSAGCILVDGQDILRVQLASLLLAAIAIVPQDTPLFHANILHNMRYRQLGASEEEVVAAMKKA